MTLKYENYASKTGDVHDVDAVFLQIMLNNIDIIQEIVCYRLTPNSPPKYVLLSVGLMFLLWDLNSRETVVPVTCILTSALLGHIADAKNRR